MISAIEYRGPDDSGEYFHDDVQLAVVRLAIIDLKGGRQPVTGRDDRVVTVYNGEIYNYLDLSRELRSRGHHLPNACDSTVVPHLYEEQGEALVHSLRGMYAFAVWDGRKRKLFLVRDRLGIKPLYYAQTPDFLLFASEAKAILASGLVQPEIDREAIDDLFSLSYPCPPRTMFRHIFELRPGHAVSVEAGHSIGTPQRYWRAPFPARGEYRRGRAADLEAQLYDLLQSTTYDHLQSDVRVGSYLSGGLDSSVITALIKDVTGDAPVTFSVGFSDPKHDELPFAQEMADHLGSENHTVICGDEAAALLPRTIWHTELPLQFPIALPLLQLSNVARLRGFPVVLTGEGADELMGGYDCFRAQKMRRLLDRPLLKALRPHVYRQLYRWHGMPDGAVKRILEIQQRPIDSVAKEFSGVFPAWYDNWQVLDYDRVALLAPDGRDVRPTDCAPEGFSGVVHPDAAAMHPLDAQLALELETRLPSWILLIGDRASMANSVEARLPLLDHRVVEFIASVDPSMKMKGFTEKALLRGAIRGQVPNVVRRRQKRPFYTPIKSWFFGPGSPEYVGELLSEGAIRDARIFAPEVVKKMLQEISIAPDNSLRRVQLEWMLILVLGTQLLHQMFVAGSQRRPPGWAVAGRQ